MLRYDRQTKPGLVALYDIRPGNGVGPFLQPRSPHGAEDRRMQFRVTVVTDPQTRKNKETGPTTRVMLHSTSALLLVPPPLLLSFSLKIYEDRNVMKRPCSRRL